jgi:hypothetical protein
VDTASKWRAVEPRTQCTAQYYLADPIPHPLGSALLAPNVWPSVLDGSAVETSVPLANEVEDWRKSIGVACWCSSHMCRLLADRHGGKVPTDEVGIEVVGMHARLDKGQGHPGLLQQQ